jgi:hypothetical protein
MPAAYLDSSWLIAITFGEGNSPGLQRRLDKFERVLSSNLLEAEWLSACARENVEPVPTFLDRISWIIPDRPLHDEIRDVLGAGHVRGADCWHLASALYAAGQPGDLSFLSLDKKQIAVAKALGFGT